MYLMEEIFSSELRFCSKEILSSSSYSGFQILIRPVCNQTVEQRKTDNFLVQSRVK